MTAAPALRDVSVEELHAAMAVIRGRVARLVAAGTPEDEAMSLVAAGDDPIIEGESCADTLLRFGFIPRQARPTIEERLAALEVLGTVPVILAAGDVLIIRTTDLTPNQIREYQLALDIEHENGHFPFQSVVVHGDELAAARAAGEFEDQPLDLSRVGGAEPRSFMDDVREETSGNGHAEHVRLTHLPTGVAAEGATRGEAMARLGQSLLGRGDITVNGARAAYGLPPFGGDFANARLDRARAGGLTPLDLEAAASRIWPTFPHTSAWPSATCSR